MKTNSCFNASHISYLIFSQMSARAMGAWTMFRLLLLSPSQRFGIIQWFVSRFVIFFSRVTSCSFKGHLGVTKLHEGSKLYGCWPIEQLICIAKVNDRLLKSCLFLCTGPCVSRKFFHEVLSCFKFLGEVHAAIGCLKNQQEFPQIH